MFSHTNRPALKCRAVAADQEWFHVLTRAHTIVSPDRTTGYARMPVGLCKVGRVRYMEYHWRNAPRHGCQSMGTHDATCRSPVTRSVRDLTCG